MYVLLREKIRNIERTNILAIFSVNYVLITP